MRRQSSQRYSFALPDGMVSLAHRTGVQRAGEANTALIQATRRIRGERVFVTGPSSTASALWAAKQGVVISMWTEHCAEAVVIRNSFRANRLSLPNLAVNADFSALEPGSCNLALIHLPRGKALQKEQLQLAASMVKEKGKVCFVGAKNEGIKGAVTLAEEVFGQAGIIVRKKGFHAGMAISKGDHPLPTPEPLTTDISVHGHPTKLIAYPGAFAPDRLDVGAAALIKAMEIIPGQQILDLGCGTGLAGLTALRCGAEVTFSDVSARAVASTQATLIANGFSDCDIHHAYGAEGFTAGQFDCVITNPPFHTGHDRDYALPKLFVSETARVLRAGGTAFFVTNSFLKYEPWLKAAFQQVSIASEDSQFRVWKAIK